jgi:hypothetical protein
VESALLSELSDEREVGQPLLEQRQRPLVAPQATSTDLEVRAGRVTAIAAGFRLAAQLAQLGQLVGGEQHQRFFTCARDLRRSIKSCIAPAAIK